MIESIWVKATNAHQALASDDLIYYRISEDSLFNHYAGADRDGNLLFILKTQGIPPSIAIDTAALDYFRSQIANNNGWLMVLRLKDVLLKQVFARLCNDILENSSVLRSEASAIDLFKERLILWKKLFLKDGIGVMEKFQLKGLIAELLALREFLESENADPAETVLAWRGPDKHPQDFVFPTQAVEIKSISPHSTHVGISSENQLESSVPLLLKVYEMEECSGDVHEAINIASLIAVMEDILGRSVEASRVFREKLELAGYVDHEYYRTINFRLTNVTKFEVSDNFPKLIKSTLPTGISELSYSIELSFIQKFLIA